MCVRRARSGYLGVWLVTRQSCLVSSGCLHAASSAAPPQFVLALSFVALLASVAGLSLCPCSRVRRPALIFCFAGRFGLVFVVSLLSLFLSRSSLPRLSCRVPGVVPWSLGYPALTGMIRAMETKQPGNNTTSNKH